MKAVKLEALWITQLSDMVERGKGSGVGGTPVSTEDTRPGGKHGELRNSMSMNLPTFSVGYTASYAPHVEYGHRTRGKGYVEGQRFLQKNVEEQMKVYIEDLQKALKDLIEK